MTYIVIISTQWGFLDGGVNCFNYDFSNALKASLSNTRYRLILISYENTLSTNGHRQFNESTITPIIVEESKALDQITSHLNNLIDVSSLLFVGHDIFTGPLANSLRIICKHPGKSVVFHHLDSSSYYPLKRPESIEENRRKTGVQYETLQSADLVVSIGPKLFADAKNKIGQSVKMLIPGFHNIEVFDMNDKLAAITFGRYDIHTDNLKQMRLAAIAFVSYVDKHRPDLPGDPTLSVIGVRDESEFSELNKTLNTLSAVNIELIKYINDRPVLFNKIARSSFCLMLSVHEGFGLAGYEAIAAGVPLILSKNSGLYIFLKRLCGERQLHALGIYDIDITGYINGSINNTDLISVQTAIHEVWNNLNYYKTGILKLREFILTQNNWQQCSQSFIDMIEDIEV
ncbi:MAG: glycosyltransferase [Chitinophagaceae bacterium]